MWLGIDPGRSKCGWALVEKDGALCLSGIIPSDIPDGWISGILSPLCEMRSRLKKWTIESLSIPDSPIERVILGRGTGSKAIKSQLVSCFSFEVKTVDEKNTTLAARRLYWNLHPPSGLWKFVPVSVRIPPRDLDDLAAWVMVLQMIEKGEK